MVNIKRRNVVKGITAVTVASAFNPVTLFADERGPTAVVIGSGIAGLSAAWELKQAGFRVTVFEKQHKAGGRMRQDWMGSIYGPVHATGIWSGNTEMWDLGEQIGLAKELANQPKYPIYGWLGFGVKLDNGYGIYRTTPTFDLDNLRKIPGMSDETKRKLPSLVPDLEEMAQSGADPSLLHTCTDFDDEDTWDYFVRKLGRKGAREFIDYWYYHMWLEVWNWDAETTSRVATLPFLAQSNKQRWVLPSTGIDLIVRELAKLVHVQVNTTVRRISPVNNQGRHTVHYLSPVGERLSVTPDVVISAIEGNYVPAIAEGLSDQEKEFFNQLHLHQFYLVNYLLKEGSGPMFLPAGNDYLFGATPTPNHPRARAKLGVWTVVPENPEDYKKRPSIWYAMDRSRANDFRASGKNLADYCLPLVQQLYPEMNADIVDDAVVRGGDYLIHVPTGLARSISRFHQMQNKARRGLYFTGEYMGHAHTGGACAAGRVVARNVVRHWS